MMRPGLADTAFEGVLVRELCLDEAGRFLSDEDPETWALADTVEPQMVRVADVRLSLLGTSLDERRIRAVYEIEGYPADSPIGVTEPRMGDFLAVEAGMNTRLNYRVVLTHGEVLAGVPEDLGPHELILTAHGMWTVDPEGE